MRPARKHMAIELRGHLAEVLNFAAGNEAAAIGRSRWRSEGDSNPR